MNNKGVALDQHYDDLASQFRLRASEDYASLVVPTGNDTEPIHRWFRFKEAYSHLLLSRILKDYGDSTRTRLRILDPFSGSGTTLVSAASLARDSNLQQVSVHAAECNPYLHLLSTTKALAASTPIAGFDKFIATVIARAVNDGPRSQPPSLSTFHRPAFFESGFLADLVSVRDAIQLLSSDSDPAHTQLAKVCLAAAVEPVSNLRKDGRTLRFAPKRHGSNPLQTFAAVAEVFEEDLIRREVRTYTASVALQDARRMDASSMKHAPYDLALFSPPYPNNIDYSEVYKLENWLLNYVNDPSEFAALRRTTLRSHGSLRWTDEYHYSDSPHRESIDTIIRPVLAAIPEDRYARSRVQLVRGYVDDLYTVLTAVAESTAQDGLIACVVGNSLHGRRDAPLLIASDLIIAKLLDILGLRVECIEIARIPARRRGGSAHLRESIVVARKSA